MHLCWRWSWWSLQYPPLSSVPSLTLDFIGPSRVRCEEDVLHAYSIHFYPNLRVTLLASGNFWDFWASVGCVEAQAVDDVLELGGALKRGKLAMTCNEFWDWLSFDRTSKATSRQSEKARLHIGTMLRAHMSTLLHYWCLLFNFVQSCLAHYAKSSSILLRGKCAKSSMGAWKLMEWNAAFETELF